MTQPPHSGPPLSATESQRAYTRPPRRASLGARTGLLLTLVVLMAGLGISAWFMVDQSRKIDNLELVLTSAVSTIDSLQQRVRATDENISAAGSDVSHALDFWESEVRKLWDISNKRNKNWIEQNQGAVKILRNDVAAVREAIKKETATLDKLIKQVAEHSRLLDDLNGSIDQMIRKQRDMQDQLNTLNRELASFKGSVEDRIGNNEEAIASMDQFRLFVSGRLEDITQKIGAGP